MHHMITRSKRSRIPELPREIWERILKYKTQSFRDDVETAYIEEFIAERGSAEYQRVQYLFLIRAFQPQSRTHVVQP